MYKEKRGNKKIVKKKTKKTQTKRYLTFKVIGKNQECNTIHFKNYLIKYWERLNKFLWSNDRISC